MSIYGRFLNEKVMKSIYNILTPTRLILILLGIVILVHGSYLIYVGKASCPDGDTFAEWADKLIMYKFNYLQYSNSLGTFQRNMYTGFISVVALNRIMFGPAWEYGVLGFNLFCDVLTAFLLLTVVWKSTQKILPLVLVGILYALSFEICLWLSYVLTDMSFVFLSFFVLSLSFMSSSAKEKKHALLLWIATFFAVLLSMAFRPGVIQLFAFFVFAFIIYFKINATDSEVRVVFARNFGLLFVTFAILGIFSFAYIIQDPSRLFFDSLIDYAASWRKYYIRGEELKGVVVFNRPYTYHNTPVSLLDYVLIILDKFLHFFAISTKIYSLKHKIFNCLLFIPTYGLALISLCELFRKKSKLSPEEWNLAFLSAMFVLIFALFHSITVLDYDWRYRLPCIPPLIVLAGIGSMQLKRYWNNLRKMPAGTKL